MVYCCRLFPFKYCQIFVILVPPVLSILGFVETSKLLKIPSLSIHTIHQSRSIKTTIKTKKLQQQSTLSPSSTANESSQLQAFSSSSSATIGSSPTFHKASLLIGSHSQTIGNDHNNSMDNITINLYEYLQETLPLMRMAAIVKLNSDTYGFIHGVSRRGSSVDMSSTATLFLTVFSESSIKNIE